MRSKFGGLGQPIFCDGLYLFDGFEQGGIEDHLTQLRQAALLSFSMVSMDGSEMYAELDLAMDPIGQARLQASSNFTRNTVTLQFGRLPTTKCMARELGYRAGQWFIALVAGASEQITVAYDYDHDFDLLRDAMLEASIWDRVQPLLVPKNIDNITGGAEGALAAEASWLESSMYRGLERHHALADALALRAAWRAACCG